MDDEEDRHRNLICGKRSGSIDLQQIGFQTQESRGFEAKLKIEIPGSHRIETINLVTPSSYFDDTQLKNLMIESHRPHQEVYSRKLAEGGHSIKIEKKSFKPENVKEMPISNEESSVDPVSNIIEFHNINTQKRIYNNDYESIQGSATAHAIGLDKGASPNFNSYMKQLESGKIVDSTQSDGQKKKIFKAAIVSCSDPNIKLEHRDFDTIGTIGACMMSNNTNINKNAFSLAKEEIIKRELPSDYVNEVPSTGNFQNSSHAFIPKQSPVYTNNNFNNSNIMLNEESNLDSLRKALFISPRINLSSNFIIQRKDDIALFSSSQPPKSLTAKRSNRQGYDDELGNNTCKQKEKKNTAGSISVINNTEIDELVFSPEARRGIQNESQKYKESLEMSYKLKQLEEELISYKEHMAKEMMMKENFYKSSIDKLIISQLDEVKKLKVDHEENYQKLKKDLSDEIEYLNEELSNQKRENYVMSSRPNYKQTLSEFQKKYNEEMISLNKAFNEFKMKASNQLDILNSQKECALKQVTHLKNCLDKTQKNEESTSKPIIDELTQLRVEYNQIKILYVTEKRNNASLSLRIQELESNIKYSEIKGGTRQKSCHFNQQTEVDSTCNPRIESHYLKHLQKSSYSTDFNQSTFQSSEQSRIIQNLTSDNSVSRLHIHEKPQHSLK